MAAAVADFRPGRRRAADKLKKDASATRSTLDAGAHRRRPRRPGRAPAARPDRSSASRPSTATARRRLRPRQARAQGAGRRRGQRHRTLRHRLRRRRQRGDHRHRAPASATSRARPRPRSRRRCSTRWAPRARAAEAPRRWSRVERRRARRAAASSTRPRPLAQRIAANVGRAVEVRDEVLDGLLVALAAEGHVLIEDLPGRRQDDAGPRARPLDRRSQFARVQCTADLLPADVVGTERLQPARGSASSSGPGRSSPTSCSSTRSTARRRRPSPGLLECMQERRVTVDVHTHELARPFLVLATQNPIEYEGTYPLPEAQVDRFMVRALARLPERRRRGGDARRPRDRRPRLDARARRHGRPRCWPRRTRPPGCARPTALRDYIVALLGRTRADPRVELGASPRAGLMLLRAAKARALLEGRDHALPDDVQALAQPVLAHRLAARPGGGRRDRRRRSIADAIARDPGAVAPRPCACGARSFARARARRWCSRSRGGAVRRRAAATSPASRCVVLGSLAAGWVALAARGGARAAHASPRAGSSRTSRCACASTSAAALLAAPGGEVDEPLLGEPAPLPAGRRRRAAAAIEARFARRGRRELEPSRARGPRPARPRRAHGARLGQPAGERARAPAHRARASARRRARRRPASAAGRCWPGAAEVEIDGLRPATARARPPRGSTGRRWPAARACSSAGCAPTPTAVRSSCSTPRAEREEDLDAAVRAAASLALQLAGARRLRACCCPATAARRDLDADLAGWPELHARLALVEAGRAAAPGAGGRRARARGLRRRPAAGRRPARARAGAGRRRCSSSRATAAGPGPRPSPWPAAAATRSDPASGGGRVTAAAPCAPGRTTGAGARAGRTRCRLRLCAVAALAPFVGAAVGTLLVAGGFPGAGARRRGWAPPLAPPSLWPRAGAAS